MTECFLGFLGLAAVVGDGGGGASATAAGAASFEPWATAVTATRMARTRSLVLAMAHIVPVDMDLWS